MHNKEKLKTTDNRYVTVDLNENQEEGVCFDGFKVRFLLHIRNSHHDFTIIQVVSNIKIMQNVPLYVSKMEF